MDKSNTVGDIIETILVFCFVLSKVNSEKKNKTETLCYDYQEKVVMHEFCHSNLAAVCAVCANVISEDLFLRSVDLLCTVLPKPIFTLYTLLWFAAFEITATREHRLCKINAETGLSIKWPHVEPVNGVPTTDW